MTTDLFEKAIATVSRLDPATQDDIAAAMMTLAGQDDVPIVDLTPEEDAAIVASQAAAARGEFATDEQVAALMAKYS
jgi:predicted transcriptional regulator